MKCLNIFGIRGLEQMITHVIGKALEIDLASLRLNNQCSCSYFDQGEF